MNYTSLPKRKYTVYLKKMETCNDYNRRANLNCLIKPRSNLLNATKHEDIKTL